MPLDKCVKILIGDENGSGGIYELQELKKIVEDLILHEEFRKTWKSILLNKTWTYYVD